MSRRYKATGFVPVPGVNLGDEFDADFTEVEENDLIAKGQVELLPAEYQVTGPAAVFDTPSGEKFEAALSLAQETTLTQSGHIKRVPPRAAKQKQKEDK